METEDGEIVEESKYNEMIDALTRHNVQLVDANGEYRKTYDIIKDIAAVWKDMSTMQQAAVVEALAGTRQQNIFASLMTQFGEAEEAIERMKDSAGELEEAYDIRMSSIQAHVEQMKAAFAELSMDFVNSDLAKKAVDFLTIILELLDKLVSSIGMVGSIITAIGLPIVAANFGKIATFLKDIVKSVAAFAAAKGVDGLVRLSSVAEKLSGLFAGLAAVAPVVVPMLAVLGTAAAAAAIVHKHSFESAQEDAEKLKNNLEDLKTEYDKNIDRIEELNAAKSKGDFTTQQQTELTILEAQNAALATQIELKEREYRLAKEHEVNTAKQTAARLLASADDKNGYSTEEALANYKKAEEEYKNKQTKGNKLALETQTNILVGQLQTYADILETLSSDPEANKDLIQEISDKVQYIDDTIAGIPAHIRAARNELERLAKGGNVDLLNRPVVNTEALRNAGWKDIGEGAATVYSKTYSNEDNTVALNFTPILTDENGNAVSILTPEQLQRYAEDVISGVRKDDLNLQIGTEFKGEDAVERAKEAGREISKHQAALYKEQIEKAERFSRAVKKLSKGTLDAVLKGTEDLTEAQKQEIADMGFSIGDLAEQFHSYSVAANESLYKTDGMDVMTINKIGDLTSLRDELAKTITALEDYKEAMKGGDKGDAVKEMAEIYKGAVEDIRSGRLDTKRVHYAAEMLLGEERMAELGYDLQRIASELNSEFMMALFDPEGESKKSYGQRFAKYIEDNAAQFAAAGAAVEKTANGYRFYYDNIADLASAFNMSEVACAAFLDDLDTYGVEVMRSTQENNELIETFRGIRDEAGKLGGSGDAIGDFAAYLAAAGHDSIEIWEIMKDLRNSGAFKASDADIFGAIERAHDTLEKAKEESKDTSLIDADGEIANIDAIKKYLVEQFQEPTEHQIKLTFVDKDGNPIINFQFDQTTPGANKQLVEAMEKEAEFRQRMAEPFQFEFDQDGINGLKEIFDDLAVEAGNTKDAAKAFVSVLRSSNVSDEQIGTILDALRQIDSTIPTLKEVDEDLQKLQGDLDGLGDTEANPTINVKTGAAYTAVNNLTAYLDRVSKHTYMINMGVNSFGTKVSRADAYSDYTGIKGNGGASRAQGGVTGKAGPTLVNELGPELISDRGRAFIANHGEPGFVNLSKDAIVFTAEETKEIAKKGGLVSGAHAYADGTRKGLIGRLLGGDDVPARATITGWICKICGRSNPSTVTKCRGCGNAKGASNTSAAMAMQKAQQQAKVNYTSTTTSTKLSSTTSGKTAKTTTTSTTWWYCSNCGRANPSSSSRCEYCGTPKGGKLGSAVNAGRAAANTTLSSKLGIVSNTPAYQGFNYNDLFNFGDDGSAGGGGGGGAASESRSNPQKVDWIAVKLNRIQREISDLEKVASSGLKKLSTRLDAAKKEASKLNEEIGIAQSGYDRYMQEANSVGLRSDLAEKVRNGAIDINEYDDEELRQQIQEYQEWLSNNSGHSKTNLIAGTP